MIFLYFSELECIIIITISLLLKVIFLQNFSIYLIINPFKQKNFFFNVYSFMNIHIKYN